jgi:molybdopterin/thiamine biosynthesis adenylyltransferase
MHTIVRLPNATWDTLRAYHDISDERISFLFGRAVRRGERTVILLSEAPILPADDCYHSRGSAHLRLHKDVTAALLYDFYRSDDDVLCNIHSHPFSRRGTSFSGVDDRDDTRLDRFLRPKVEKTGRHFLNLSIVLDKESFDARLTDTTRKDGPFLGIAELQGQGDHLQLMLPNSTRRANEEVQPELARQDFLGPSTLGWLAQARVGICGAGGLGSILAEAVVRLGFRQLVIVDDDRVERSNLNRLQGVTDAQVGIPKVEAVRTHLRAVAPDLQLETLADQVTSRAALHALTGCDLLIGAVDNSVARAVLNHVAVQYKIPYFDAGVDIQVQPVDFRYRLFTTLPGVTACMECSPFQLLDDDSVVQSLLNPLLEQAFRHQGYIRDVPKAKAPSVYPLNLTASGALLTELLNYLAGFRPVATTLYEGYREDRRERADRQSFVDNQPAPDCPICSHYAGLGDHAELPFGRTVDPAALLAVVDSGRGQPRALPSLTDRDQACKTSM